MFHTVGRGRRTIKESIGGVTWLRHGVQISMNHRMCPRTRDCTTTWEGWKVTIADIVHDKMSHLRHRGADDGKLRNTVERIYRKNCINEPRTGGTVEFEFKKVYKAQATYHQTTLGTLHIKSFHYQANKSMMNEAFVRASPWFQALPEDMQESLIRMVSITKDVMQNPTSQVGDTTEIPKSP